MSDDRDDFDRGADAAALAMADVFTKRLRLMREALEAVEKDEDGCCLWCSADLGYKDKPLPHKRDCLRQRALGIQDAASAQEGKDHANT